MAENNLKDALSQIDESQETAPASETDDTEVEQSEEETVEQETQDSETGEEQPSDDGASASGEEEKDQSEDTETSKSESDEEAQKKDPENTSPMRQLRNQYRDTKNERDKYANTLEKLAKAQGKNVDELMEEIENETDERLAKENNISPELQKKMRQQEERLNEVEEERKRTQFVNRIQDLQTRHPMDNTKTKEFVQKAYENGFDIMNENVDMDSVYRAVYHDEILQQEIEKERQRLHDQVEKQKQQSPTRTKASGTGHSTNKKNLKEAMREIEL